MDIRFETFVVLEEKYRQNLLVTTVFNDALKKYLTSEGVNKIIEVWNEGECTAVYSTIDDLIKDGRVKAIK